MVLYYPYYGVVGNPDNKQSAACHWLNLPLIICYFCSKAVVWPLLYVTNFGG